MSWEEARIAVLGVPVRFRSNRAAVLDLAARTFGGAASDPAETASELRVEIRVEGSDPEPPPPVLHEVSAGRVLTTRIGASRGRVDAMAGAGEVVVTETLLARPDRFRYELLEAVTLWLVTHRDRIPLHAAALVENNRGLLLTGRSGSGKSTLTYAAFRAGMQVLSEDTVYVQTRPEVRVWGLPGFLHLLPESVRFFPELAGLAAEQRVNGKTKLAVSLHRPGEPAPSSVARVGICVVRTGPRLAVESLAPAEAAQVVASHTQGGFGYWPGALEAAVERIGATGGWSLTVPPDPAEAIASLREMLARL
jgi:hypothetical protein